jgi:hypothetical protein
LVIASANNYMVRCHRANATDEIERVLTLLDNQRFKTFSLESKRKEVYYTHWLGYAITSGKTDSDEVLHAVELDIAEYGANMNQAFLMLIFSLVSQYAFLRGENRIALTWINKFLLHDNRKQLTKNIAIAETYRMLIYYQQFKLDVLESELQAASKPDHTFPEHPLITSLIHAFFHKELKDGDKRSAHIAELKTELLALKKSETENEAFEFFPFDQWASTHLN